MNNIYVLTPDFKLEGIIDEYVSNIWRPSYSDIGDFEIYLGVTEKAINLLQKNRYVVRSSDISVINYSGKNVLPYPYFHTTRENNGITWTDNGNGTISVSGDATANSWFRLSEANSEIPKNIIGKNVVVHCGLVNSHIGLRVDFYDSEGNTIGKGCVVQEQIEKIFEVPSTAVKWSIQLFVLSGMKVDNFTLYPMISLEVGEYEPYTGGKPKSITTYENVMIIKNIQLITDVENGDFYCVTGRELKFLLHQRIVWSQTNLNGKVEESIRRLVNENAITPTDSNRIIPDLILGVSAGLPEVIEKQITGEYLDKAITEICITYNYGWDIFITNNKLVFVVYAGIDRSYGQTERPYVVFSDAFENLHNTDYQLNTEEYANTTLIGGEGEGLKRVYTTVNNSKSGLNRFENFTDARDISRNVGTDDEISAVDYLNLLRERGRENLATLAYTEGFSGEILSNVSFKYGKDFFMGDIVTVINKYGIQKNVRVLSAIESEDESGVKLLPQFNI